jgi:general secretion pathway protein G
MSRRERRAGFTLIELMLVIVIIATLAAIVATNLAGKGNEGKIGATKGQIASFEEALDFFEADCGRYPTSAEGLEALRTQPSGLKGWKGPYMKKEIPLDPWGNPYKYVSPGTHGGTGGSGNVVASYDLSSFGIDGQEGTADDISSWDMQKDLKDKK